MSFELWTKTSQTVDSRRRNK